MDDLDGAPQNKKFYLVVSVNCDGSLDINSEGLTPNNFEDADSFARYVTEENGGDMVMIECVAIKKYVRGKVRVNDIRPKIKK